MEITESTSIAPVSELWKDAYKSPEAVKPKAGRPERAAADNTIVETADIEPEPVAAEDQVGQSQSQGQVDPNIVEIMQEKGTDLFDGDPELSLLDRSHGLRKLYRSIEAACDAKKARLESQAQTQGPIDPNLAVIQREKGVDLYDGDPELSMLDRSHGQHKFYRSVEAACDAKKERLASQSDNPKPTSSSSRLPPSGSPAPDIAASSHDYWKKAYK